MKIGWSEKWTRWDGKEYSNVYPAGCQNLTAGCYTPAFARKYVVLFSPSNGAPDPLNGNPTGWFYADDGSKAKLGVADLAHSVTALYYNLSTPRRSSRKGTTSSESRRIGSDMRSITPSTNTVHTSSVRETAMKNTLHRSSPQSGHTLAEMIVVMAIALVIILASFQMLEETTRVTMFIETRNDLPIIAQTAVNNIQTAISQSKQVFDGSSSGVGPGYFSRIGYPTSAQLLGNSRMPLVNPNGQFIADTSGNEYTGNCLLIARQLSPLEVSYTGGKLLADRYRFEMYYLTAGTGWKFSGYSGGYLDAMRGRSVEYADYFQLSNLNVTSAQRKEINDKLLAGVLGEDKLIHKLTLAWNPGQPATSSVYDIKSVGTPLASSYVLNANPSFALSEVKSITPQVNNAHIFGRMSYSIAFRPSGTTSYPLPTPVSRYALFDSTKPLFPSGFEFMIVGNATTKRILSRVSIMAHYRVKEYAAQEASVITAP